VVLEAGGVAESRFLVGAELGGDRVVGSSDSRNVGLGVLDNLSTLDVETSNFAESAGGGVVVGQELSNNSEGLAGIDGETLAIERLVTHAERVEVAAIGIANTAVTRSDSTIISLAASLAVNGARVGGEGGGDGVGFPDIQLVAARTVLTCASICIIRGSGPADRVGLSMDIDEMGFSEK